MHSLTKGVALLVLSTGVTAKQCSSASYSYCCNLGTGCDCTQSVSASKQCSWLAYQYCCNAGTPCDCDKPPDGTACDATGADASYSETITDGAVVAREISTNSCPNHYSYCTGKPGLCADVGERGTYTEAVTTQKTLTVPASPVLRDSYGIGVDGSDVQCEMDILAVAINGVAIFGGAVNEECEPIDVDDISSEWSSFDCCSGHSEQTGTYHYHFPPSCLLKQIGDFSDGHSPQIGWSFDGFPIYGPKGPGGVDMKYGTSSSGETLGKCLGDYCLDACGGVEMELPAVDEFKYRYYLVGAASDLSTIPTDPKPSSEAAAHFSNGRRSFTLNCYRGFIYDELVAGSTGSTGVVSSYKAKTLDGVTARYEPSGLCEGASITDESEMLNGFCSELTESSCNPAFFGVDSVDVQLA